MENKLLKQLTIKEEFQPGTIIRRINIDKDQQGCFIGYDGENLILINVINLLESKFEANEGILRPLKDDKLFYYTSSFEKNQVSTAAINVIKNWTLYKQNEALQQRILEFVKTAFAPEQIIELKESDSLSRIFVPIQEKFRIGRFKERRNPDRVCKDLFNGRLSSLRIGEHITYVALVFQQKTQTHRFYSAGTKPHQETEHRLKSEKFNFQPIHGGHLKATRLIKGRKHFIVDAGSNYFGRGVKTPFHVAESVANALKKHIQIVISHRWKEEVHLEKSRAINSSYKKINL